MQCRVLSLLDIDKRIVAVVVDDPKMLQVDIEVIIRVFKS